MCLYYLFRFDIFIVSILFSLVLFFFFFNDTATTEIYTLSLHDALPIWHCPAPPIPWLYWRSKSGRSEEHTSELQSHSDLVCRLLLEKKKKKNTKKSKKINKNINKEKKKIKQK